MWGAFLGCLGFLYYPGLIFSMVPAFRDAYHFYYPQAVWLDDCAARGEYFPRWNSYEGLGVSVAGQPSAALYYPLRILWLLPGFNVAQRFSLVIVVHLGLAAIGIRYAAGGLKLSGAAAWLAAISYSLSCPVFFQHANLIYLCSAAWIGFALGALLRLLRRRPSNSIQCCFVFAAACSMMFLAGDPHTAVNAIIVAAFVLLWWGVSRALGRRTGGSVRGPRKARPVANLCRSLAWLSAAVLMVAATTAVQWIPALRWSQSSGRFGETRSREISFDPVQDAIARQGTAPSHRIYDFSLSPWHAFTCLWPTLGGHYLPTNSRWFAALPAEGRMWIPSLYFGVVPFLLVLLALFRNPGFVSQLLLGLALFSLLASWGNYSIVWLLRELFYALGLNGLADSLPKDHVGSIYWLLTKFVPGYDVFRYPAKWTVWFIVAGSLLAGLQLEKLSGGTGRAVDLLARRIARRMLQLSLSGLAVAAILWIVVLSGSGIQLDRWLAIASPDIWLGAPDARSMAGSLSSAFAVALLSLIVLSQLALNRPQPLVYLTMAEMTYCATCWISFVAAPDLELPIAETSPAHSPPCVWVDRSEADLRQDNFIHSRNSFISDQARYQQKFLIGKLASLADVKDLGATQSIEPMELSALRRWLMGRDNLTRIQTGLDDVLRYLGVTHRLIRIEFSDQPSQFQWYALDEPQPLCELQVAGNGQASSATELSWEWIRSTQLQIRVRASHDATLLVRQYQDGGWAATIAANQALPMNEARLFLEVPVPAGEHTVLLRRKWFW